MFLIIYCIIACYCVLKTTPIASLAHECCLMQVPFVLFNIMFLFEYPKTYTAMQGFVEYVSTASSQCFIILQFCTICRSSSITFALGNAYSQNCTEGYTRGYGEGDTNCMYHRIPPSTEGVHSYHWLTFMGFRV